MHQNMSHPDNLRPRDFWIRCLDLLSYMIACFTDYLNMADDPVLDQLVIFKSLCLSSSVTLNALDGFQDIP